MTKGGSVDRNDLMKNRTENLAPRRKNAKEMKNEDDLSSAFSPLCAFESLRENFPVSFSCSAFSFPPLAILHLRRYHQKNAGQSSK